MKLKITLGKFLIRLGGFIQSLSIVVMSPKDLIEFNRLTYQNANSIHCFSKDEFVDSGLYEYEKILINALPEKKGQLLLLGLGGGREAISLARMGFEVTGVDFVSEMVNKAKDNAARRGLKIKGIIQEISNLNVPANSFDIVFLSSAMYSSIPTRVRRQKLLKKVFDALRPGGVFLCQFQWDSRNRSARKGKLVRKFFAFLTLGNLSYENGDKLWNNVEFIHIFSSKKILSEELEAGGFELISFHIGKENITRGGALLKKRILD